MRIGIDLGGSKIEGLVLGPEGEELARRRVGTPRGGARKDDYEATVRAVAELVASLAADVEARGGDGRRPGQGQQSIADVPAGIGIPGTISAATGLIKNANSTCLIGRPLDRDLGDALDRRVRLANDADCFTISEASDGAGKNFHTVFGVILGTGCGGGIAVGGKLLAGANAIAGEWGHNPLPWPQTLNGIDERPGPACYCGQSGCIETFVSGSGLEADHDAATGQSLTAEEIAALAETNDPEAKAALQRYQHRLARALASVINLLDPGVIVLGGGLSNIQTLYDTVPGLWAQWVFSDTVATELKPARHGDSSGVRGAAWLW